MSRTLVSLLALVLAFPALAQQPAGEAAATPPEVVPEEPTSPSEAPPPTAEGISLPPVTFAPFIALAGGPYYHLVVNRTDLDDNRENRFTTIALSRLGLRAALGEHISIESEFEVNAGPYGTSVWEGQAALQVRNQLVRLDYGPWNIQVGRVTDGASLDFVSFYAVGNLLLSDDVSRSPLLMSGFNRGNGVLLRYELVDGLRLGFTLNAGNPLSTTGTVMVGGTFPPFARFYEVPWTYVGRDARGFPTASFETVILSPAVLYEGKYVLAQVEGQYFEVNTNTNTKTDEHITGFNVRGGVEGLFLGGRLRPFVNGSRVENGVVDPANTAVLSDQTYVAMTGSAGFDFDVSPKVGLGAEYNYVQEQQGANGTLRQTHYASVGASYRIVPQVSVDARYTANLGCEAGDCIHKDHYFYVTLKAVLGAAGGATRRP